MEQQRTLVAVSTRELDHLREAVTRQRGVIEVLTSPGVKIEYLRHAMPGLETEGHVLWNERKKAWLFYAFGMPQPEQDKEYQVWFMTEKEGPVSAGVFMPDQSGTGPGTCCSTIEVIRQDYCCRCDIRAEGWSAKTVGCDVPSWITLTVWPKFRV